MHREVIIQHHVVRVQEADHVPDTLVPVPPSPATPPYCLSSFAPRGGGARVAGGGGAAAAWERLQSDAEPLRAQVCAPAPSSRLK